MLFVSVRYNSWFLRAFGVSFAREILIELFFFVNIMVFGNDIFKLFFGFCDVVCGDWCVFVSFFVFSSFDARGKFYNFKFWLCGIGVVVVCFFLLCCCGLCVLMKCNFLCVFLCCVCCIVLCVFLLWDGYFLGCMLFFLVLLLVVFWCVIFLFWLLCGWWCDCVWWIVGKLWYCFGWMWRFVKWVLCVNVGVV